jgi:5-methylcytosine-specific restriction endonuclease McrA
LDFIWVTKENGVRKKRFKCMCPSCGADRGYQEKRALNRLCKKCANNKPMSEETKQKLSKANSGRKKTTEQIEKSARWQRGKIVSEETKQKMREARLNNPNPGGAAKGSKKSDTWRQKVKQTHAEKYGLTVEEHNAWIREKDDRRYFKSSGLILECYKRDDFTCHKCKARGGRLNAHHINSWKFFPEERMLLENLATLCTSCHKDFHRKNGNGISKPNTREQFEEWLTGHLTHDIMSSLHHQSFQQ